MNVNEFSKSVQPSPKKSRLTPFINDIIELRNKGYTLQQIQKFLEKNEVITTLQNVNQFLKRHESTSTTQQPYKEIKAISTKQINQSEAEEEPFIGSHRPSDLDKVMRQKVDMAALAKYAKGMKI